MSRAPRVPQPACGPNPRVVYERSNTIPLCRGALPPLQSVDGVEGTPDLERHPGVLRQHLESAHGILSRHRHDGPVHAYVIKGRWYYLEHDWTAIEGSYAHEIPGEVHTLYVPDDVYCITRPTSPLLALIRLENGFQQPGETRLQIRSAQ